MAMARLVRLVRVVLISLLGVLGLWAGVVVYSAVSTHGSVWAWAAAVVTFLFIVVAGGLAFDYMSSALRRERR